LELVHTNLCGLARKRTLKGGSYFMLLIDDYTRMTWVRVPKEKSEAFEKFQSFKSLVENENDLKIKCLRLDRGGEFTLMNLMNSVRIMESRDIFQQQGKESTTKWSYRKEKHKCTKNGWDNVE
jgi:hypothetical protein